MWLDCDTTPAIKGRYSRCKTLVGCKRAALRLIATVSEGQIGIYHNYTGGEFYGYAIKNAGEAPYFEEPETQQ